MKTRRKFGTLLSIMLVLAMVIGCFSSIKVHAADDSTFKYGNGKIKIVAHVRDKATKEAVSGEVVSLFYIDFTGEVEEALAYGWNSILDALGEDENSIWRWTVDHQHIGTAVTNSDGDATFLLDSTVDWICFYNVDKNDAYQGAYRKLPYLPNGRVGIVIPGLLQRNMIIDVEKQAVSPTDPPVTPTNPEDDPSDPNDPNNPNNPDKPKNPDDPDNPSGGEGEGGGTTIIIPGGGGTEKKEDDDDNGPSAPSAYYDDYVDEPEMIETEPEFFDVFDDETAQGSTDIPKQKEEPKKEEKNPVVKDEKKTADESIDLDLDDTAKGDTDIPVVEETKPVEEETKEVNFVDKVEVADNKADTTADISPATVDTTVEKSIKEGVLLQYWLLWIIIGIVLVAGGITIYVKKRKKN